MKTVTIIILLIALSSMLLSINNLIDTKSMTGYVIGMYKNVIHWKSGKPNSVTTSSTEVELVALSECVSELKVIKDLMLDRSI